MRIAFVDFLYRSQCLRNFFLLGKLLLFLLIHIFKSYYEFISLWIGLYQLALEILHNGIAENPVIEIISLFIRQQRVDAGNGSNHVKQMSVFFQHIMFNIVTDITLIVSRGKFPAVSIVHRLSHAITDSLTGVRIHRVNVFIRNGKGLNQAVLRSQFFLFSSNPAKRT